VKSKFKLLLSLFLFSSAVWGQESRGTILGRIVDPSGAAVAGAGIEAVNVDTRVVLRTTSNEVGNYQIPFVVPGNYLVVVDHSGFKKLQRDGIRVLTGTQVTVDLQLELGAASDSVTVTDSAPLLNPASGDLGQVLDSKVLSTTTMGLSRNVLYTVALAPGVYSGSGTVTGNGSGQYQISGGGSMTARVEYLIDGIPNTVAQNAGGVVYIPSIDAVDEIKVQTTMFDAAYGHSNAGAINITTKGGTNAPHGTIYMYKQWGVFNANSWSNNKNGTISTETCSAARYIFPKFTTAGTRRFSPPLWNATTTPAHGRFTRAFPPMPKSRATSPKRWQPAVFR